VLRFPSDAALIALHARGVTHVVVHEARFVENFGRERYEAIGKVASLRVVAEDGDIHLLRLR